MKTSARNRFSTTGYTARRYVLFAFAVIYTIVAHWGGKVSPIREFFPVFNWSLFTRIYPLQMLPELYVASIGHQKFEPAPNYIELDAYFESARRRNIIFTKTLGRLHAAIVRDDTAEVTRLRKIIEMRHLSGHGPVEYEVRSVNFDSVQRWLDADQIVSQTVVGRFRSEDGT